MKVKFFDAKTMPFAKLALGTALLFVGIVIGVLAVFAVAVLNKPSPEGLKEVLLQDAVKYITAEQKSLGIECNELNKTIRAYLEQDLRPVLNSYQSGENWYKGIDADMRKRMSKLRYDYSSCGRLFSEAKRVNWDGLEKFGYSSALEYELAVLNTLIGFEFCDVNDAKCLGKSFIDLEDAVTKIEIILTPTELKGPPINGG